ncbi:RNA polymerase II elongator-like protein [Thozetella sp. PMI_491]|nr:RNA polymerase II elongator-like protein [Thozetella sp. PMI_491]
MRNLRCVRHRQSRADAEITAACWDAANDEVLVTHGPTEQNPRIELVRIGDDVATSTLQQKSVASWDALSPNPDLAVDRVVSLHHFSDALTTCVVLAGGDIVIVREQQDFASSDGAHVEIVGSIDAGITTAQWSPDEEVLVITTTAGTVVFMSRSFDGIGEATMTAEDLKLSKHVTVGWGKKETQFQGKGAKAKALRDPTIPEKVDEGASSPNDDGRTTVSWRGDGAYVAINAIEAAARRVVRIYTREGVLDSVTEPVDGLEGSLSWRPAGNLMAAIQRLPGRIDVVFFERNGLRHGQFTLRIPNDSRAATEDVGLEWNSDSTVLAVSLRDRVQLWTMGNYHWYLKQEILCGEQRPHIKWHPEKALQLSVATSSKLVLREYILAVTRGPTIPPHDYGVVAVIDGQFAKITPLRQANVPPPMALFEVEVESSIVDIAFQDDNSQMAILHNHGVQIYSFDINGPRLSPPGAGKSIAFEKSEAELYDEAVLQASFSGDSTVLILEGGQETWLRRIDFESGASNSKTPANGITSFITAHGLPGRKHIAQDSTGRLSYDSGDNQDALTEKLSTFLPWAEAVSHAGELLTFGLSRNGHLYANSRQLAKNTTSFVLTLDHLIFTTTNHLVKFVHLASPEELEVPLDDPENDERCRSLERGARLVTAMPTNMNLVLQMPRGNLETIFPRAMVLAGIRQLIDDKNYQRAFSYCRTQRVDMNILCDYQPEQFLSNVGLFLKQLEDATYIDLFISSLKEEDVTQTMYKDTKRGRLQAELPPQTANQPTTALSATQKVSKVNTICDAILKSLHTQKNANLQNIITANVCKNPPALEDGLLVVAELMQENETLAERAVEHICFLVDVNQLYDHAIGLYNLDLALLVAQQSQRDPREYLPFIQNLHQLPDLRRRFAIDDHLERREKALEHLKSLDVFDEFQNYTTRHSLYQVALGLYRYDEQRHNTLTGLYAEYLEATSKFREAGLAYEFLANYPRATACYRAAGATCWQECLFAAQQQSPSLSVAAFGDLATALADALYEAKDYASAATIHLEYLASPETAIRCFCKGSFFADAFRLVARHNRPELLESTVDPCLTEALSSTTEFLAECKAQLKAQVPRIAELRRRAIEDPLAFYEGERPWGHSAGDVPDDVSIAASSRLSTGGSLFTRYTNKGGGSVGTIGSNVSRATSKKRAREEKKRARGRKGTVYEEEYLVSSVRRLVERVESTNADIEKLVFALARRSMGERARAVEALTAEVVELCKVAVADVWQPTRAQEGSGGQIGPGSEGEAALYGYRPTGGDAVLQESLEARTARKEPPPLKEFARLSLLG